VGVALALAMLGGGARAVLGANALTYHYDNWRTGWNDSETQLTSASLRTGGFGLLHNIPLDDQVDAQPLLVEGAQIGGSIRNVLYIVTESNTVWAIDSVTGEIIRHVGLKNHRADLNDAAPVPKSAVGCGNNAPNIGITSTPVIDVDKSNTANSTLYLIAFSLDGGSPTYYLHALDLDTLADKTDPVRVAASATLLDSQKYSFDGSVSRQRAGMVVTSHGVFAAFGSFCDHKADRTRGWLMGWDKKTLQPLSGATQLLDHRIPSSASYFLTSVWMSGYGVAADEAGDLYFTTGNSHLDRLQPPLPVEIGKVLPESVIKARGDLAGLTDFFTPSDPQIGAAALDNRDEDFGSGGVMLIPADPPGSTRHLAVAMGKAGTLYLLDRDNLGKFDHSGTNHVLGAYQAGSCWCGPSYFVGPDGQGRVVTSGEGEVMVWRLDPGTHQPALVREFSTTLPTVSTVFQKGFFTTVSSNGRTAGTAVIWAVQRPTKDFPPKLTLHALDARDGSVLFSHEAGDWPNTGGAANTVPVVSGGRVYVASYKQLQIFGLGAPSQLHVATAELATAELAPRTAVSHRAVIYGTVVRRSGNTLWLRTRNDMVGIDLSAALSEGLVSPLTPGAAVRVEADVDARAHMKAREVEYAADSPSYWQDEQR
jgi:hypothetical protein